PTGDAFNSIIRLEMHKPGKPFNPMINAGALTVSSILPGESALGKMESLHDVIEKNICKRLDINLELFM
ncbi:glutaminase, partial [Streptomyces sp. MS2A]|nr:glutaminase [Streptomyces sp. MS2A]